LLAFLVPYSFAHCPQTIENEFINQINASVLPNQALLSGKAKSLQEFAFPVGKWQNHTGKGKNFQEKPEAYKKRQNLTGMANSIQETGKV
jgi:hypothetical protein